MKLALLDRLLAAGGSAAALATDLTTGAQWMVTAQGCVGDGELGTAAMAQVRRSIDEDQSQTIETETGPLFVEVWNPPLRLIVVGGVHTAQALVPLARLVGYDVTVVDPRSAFATPARFPDTKLVTAWPDQAVPGLRPDRRTAIVTLTHNSRIDDPALAAGLRTEAFYIGALGSRRTHAQRCTRLTESGFDAAAIGRIHGPVGLALGALTPGEIAVSIVAEMTAALRRSPLANRAPA
ncbi:MAG: XdhC family protein [Steroidobacteraceae bacterium]